MLNISLPEKLQTFLQAQAAAAGLSTESEYVHSLVLREQSRLAQQSRIDQLLLEGVESGPLIEVTDEWWEQKRTQISERTSQPEG